MKDKTKGKEDYTWGDGPGWADWPDADHWPSVYGPGTAHLPEAVVEQEFSLKILCRTSKEDPRVGEFSVALQFGDRENPKDLTADEAEYLREMLRTIIKLVTADDLVTAKDVDQHVAP